MWSSTSTTTKLFHEYSSRRDVTQYDDTYEDLGEVKAADVVLPDELLSRVKGRREPAKPVVATVYWHLMACSLIPCSPL